MAKNDKAKSKGGKANAAKKPVTQAPEFGVPELAKHLGVAEATVRINLRKAEVAKTGKHYGWNTRDDMLKVAKKIGGDGKAADTKSAKKAAPVPKRKAA